MNPPEPSEPLGSQGKNCSQKIIPLCCRDIPVGLRIARRSINVHGSVCDLIQFVRPGRQSEKKYNILNPKGLLSEIRYNFDVFLFFTTRALPENINNGTLLRKAWHSIMKSCGHECFGISFEFPDELKVSLSETTNCRKRDYFQGLPGMTFEAEKRLQLEKKL